MDKNKIGTLFIVSVLALAGIGISYAGLTDTIYVYGSVNTARVQFEDFDYTGTHVWKILDQEANEFGSEITVTDDLEWVPEDDGLAGWLISWAYSYPGNEQYDVLVEYHNLMPCIDYVADLHFKIGSIPVKVSNIEYGVLTGEDWIDPLVDNKDIWATMYTDTGKIVELGTQIHPDEEVTLELHIHLPQDNSYQEKSGSFSFTMEIIQWTDQCDEETPFDIQITKTVENPEPFYGIEFTYTISVENLGPGDATDVIVHDTLPDGVTHIENTTSQGEHDNSTGVWNVGDITAGETATLEITVTILELPEIEYTQLALLIDGSGSIEEDDWDIMLEGIALAITDGYIPHNGRVELTVIQLGGWEGSGTGISGGRSWAQVELGGPIVLTEDNYNTVANLIWDGTSGISQLGGGTPISCAFRLAADVLSGDANGYLAGSDFAGWESQNSDWPNKIVNLVTDGKPNIIYIHEERYAGWWPGAVPEEFVLGKADAEDARNYFIDTVNPYGEYFVEIDAEAVGTDTEVDWLKENIVWPKPGYDTWPPEGPGWVRYIDEYTELAETLKEKFELLFLEIENCATLISPEDINPDNNHACVKVIPQLNLE